MMPRRSWALAAGLCAFTLGLGAQTRPESKPTVPVITNRNLEQFQPGALAVSNGAAAAPAGATGPALTFPRDRGAHLASPLERWTLKALLTSPEGGAMPFQLTFVSRGLTKDPDDAPWSRSRLLSAQATLALEGGRKLLAEARRGRLGIPAETAEDRLGLRCDGWSITDPGDGRYHLDIPMSGGRLRLTLTYRSEPLSLPALDPGDPQRRTLRAGLEAEGRLELEGRPAIALAGKALLLQEWGTDLSPETLGWDRAFAFLRNGRTLLYLGTRTKPGNAAGKALLLELNPQGQPSAVHRPPALKPRRFWSSHLSRARYPVAVQIQDPRQALAFEPMMDEQEWLGDWVGALSLWSGFGTLKNPQGALIGDAFLELAGVAHPVQGRY